MTTKLYQRFPDYFSLSRSFTATFAAVQGYQREVVALIRGSGARVSVLHEHRLVDLWREYSARQYRGGWIKGDREEVFRFITWSNQLNGISREIRMALREHARAAEMARVRRKHSTRITTLADEAVYFRW